MWYQAFDDGEERGTSVFDRSADGAMEALVDSESWSNDCKDTRDWVIVWKDD